MLKPISRFVDECCLLARNARYPALDLYLVFVHWCLQNAVPVQDQFTFLEVLDCYGLKYREKRQRAWFKGIAVLPEYRMDVAERPE
jgi:hypothetical protein